MRTEKWLVIDDSQKDADLIFMALNDLGAECDVAKDLKSAELLLRKNDYDFVALDYIFKIAKQTGDEILPLLRAALPFLPVIAMSRSEDPQIPSRVISAGADAFVPKFNNTLTLMKLLAAASKSASAARKLKLGRELSIRGNSEVYLERRNLELLELATRRRSERVLIAGVPGTGRTSVADLLATSYLRKIFGDDSCRPIIRIPCASLSKQILEVELFGEAELLSDRIRLTAFERANGGVLILDDIDFLDPSSQLRLKHFFERLDSGTVQSSHSGPKIIAIAARGKVNELEPGFLGTLSHRILETPSLVDIEEKKSFLDFCASKFGVCLQQDLTDFLTKAFSTLRWKHDISSFVVCLQRASLVARDEERSVLGIPDFDFTLDASVATGSEAQSSPPGNSISPQELRLSKLVNGIQRGGISFDKAKDELRDVMIRYSLDRHDWNKKKVAEELGVSRQTVYDALEEQTPKAASRQV
jgi:DNA-binding NtrC family response regulator